MIEVLLLFNTVAAVIVAALILTAAIVPVGPTSSRCGRCGYDLRGRAPDSRVCPECGTSISRRDPRHAGRGERRALAILAVLAAALTLSLDGLFIALMLTAG